MTSTSTQAHSEMTSEWSDDGTRGLMMPYADPRAYSDRLNRLFTPAGWTRKYSVQASAPVQRSKRGPAAKILVTCEVTIGCIGTNSGTAKNGPIKRMRLPAPRHRRSSVLCPASDSGATCTTWRASGSSRTSTAYQRRNPSCRDRAQGSGELQICPAFFEQGSGDPGHLRECRYFPRLSSRISFRDCRRRLKQARDDSSPGSWVPRLLPDSRQYVRNRSW